MKAWPWLLFFGIALAAVGAPYSYGQAPDPFTTGQMGPGPGAPKANPGIDCNAEFSKHNSEMQKRGLALKTASERKAGVKDACVLLRRYTSTEAEMIAFLKKWTGPCGIPPDFLKQLTTASTKSVTMRDQVCKAAAGQAAAPPPAPSQGLSGVLGGGTGFTNDPGGSGVFDSLTGNVLRQ